MHAFVYSHIHISVYIVKECRGRITVKYICLSSVKLYVRFRSVERFTRNILCNENCQWPTAGRWFSPESLVFSTNGVLYTTSRDKDCQWITADRGFHRVHLPIWYHIQHHVITFDSDTVGRRLFFRILRLPLPITMTASIYFASLAIKQ